MFGLLEALKGARIKRESMPFSRYVLVYCLRCLARIPSQNTLPDMLFTGEHLMRRIGFNAHQMGEGLTQRGASLARGPGAIFRLIRRR